MIKSAGSVCVDTDGMGHTVEDHIEVTIGDPETTIYRGDPSTTALATDDEAVEVQPFPYTT